MITRTNPEARYGTNGFGGIYYRIGGIPSADVYADEASARQAAGRQQIKVTIGKGVYLRPAPDLTEWH